MKICPQCNENVVKVGDYCSSCEMLMSFFYDGHQDYKIIMDNDLFQKEYLKWLKNLSFYGFYWIWFNYWTRKIIGEGLRWEVV